MQCAPFPKKAALRAAPNKWAQFNFAIGILEYWNAGLMG
jgi:hypothetical protein